MKKLLLFIGLVLLMMLPMVSADVNTSLVSYWTLDANGNDYFNRINLTNLNTVTFPAGGIINNTGSFVSASSQALRSNSATQLPTSGSFTISCWYKGTTANMGVCGFGEVAGGGQRRQLEIRSSNLYFGGFGAGNDADSGIQVTSNTWTLLTVTYDGATIRTYVNGTAGATQATVLNTANATFNIGYNVAVGYANGLIDEVGVWNTTLSTADILYLYNGGTGNRPFNTTFANVTVSAYNFYTNASLTNFTAYITNGSVQINQTTTNGTIQTIIPANSSYLWDITFESNESGGYFNETYTGVNVSSNVNKSMAQNTYSFYAVEKVTGANLTGFNFSSVRGSTTYAINQTHYLSNGTYSITAFKSGYYNKTTAITATNLFNGTQNISYVGNHSLNITARDNFTNALINSFSVRVVNTTYSYTETYSTTNGIILDNTTSVQLTYEASATGYFNTTGVLTLTGNSSNNTIVMTPYGGLQVKFIRSSNGSLILSPTQTVMFQNTTSSTSFTGINGTANITNLVEDTYLVLCQVTGFDNNSYTYDYPATTDTHPSIFYCIMSSGTTPITFQIQAPDLTPLGNVLIQIEQFVNGSFATVASDYTDGTGQSVLNLVQGLTTRITLSLAGYTTQVNVNNLDATTYIYTLDPVNRFDPSNSAGSSITYSFYPTQFDLNLSVWGFTLNVTPDSGTLLDYFKITIANASGSIITQFNSTNSSGGNITIPFNTTPYNGSTLRVTYSFKKVNSTEFQVLVVYNIADNYITGSIIGARNYILANFDLGERIFLWMFLTICSALLLSALGIKDLLNVFLTSVIWLGLAYVFAMNTIIVGLIFFLLFLAIVRYTL